MAKSFPTLLRLGKDSPLDFTQIKAIVGHRCNLGFRDHESLPSNPTVKQIFGAHDAVCILLHVLHGTSSIAHWICLVRGSPIQVFDPLGHDLGGLYRITKEEPKLRRALQGHRYHSNLNKVQAQKANIRDCGCHCAIRCVFWKWSNRDYVRFLRTHYGSTDDTVTTLCALHLLDQKMLDAPPKNIKPWY